MILVTGGAGFIGSHTSTLLLDRGEEIVVLDDFSNSDPAVIERMEEITGKPIPCVAGDLCDIDAVEGVFSHYPIDAVIHFAGKKAVGESVKKPLLYYRNNLIGTMNLLDVMGDYGVKKIIFSSSATVYRADNPIPYLEGYPLGCVNPYGWTKMMAEQIIEDVCAADPEWSAVLLRYFNPIGAHPSGKIGEDPKGIPNNLLPYVAKVAVGDLAEIHVFGDDYDTKDGTGVRDYIHVMDLADGHIKALDYAKGHKGTLAVNLGTGTGYSVMDVIRAFEKACGKTLPYVIDPRRAGDLPAYYADTAFAKKTLGFATQYDLEKMCEDTWRWQQYSKNEL